MISGIHRLIHFSNRCAPNIINPSQYCFLFLANYSFSFKCKTTKKPIQIIHPSMQGVFCFVLHCFVTREGEEERRGTSLLRLVLHIGSWAWFWPGKGPGTVSVAALRVKSSAGTAQSSMRDGDLSLPCFCFCSTQFSLVARIGRWDGVLSSPLLLWPGELFILDLLLPGACWTLEQLG